MEDLNYKKGNIERKYLKIKSSLLEWEIDFIELNYIEMRDRVVKIKREIEGMDRFVEEEMKNKITPIKNTWYDWLINYIPKPMRKRVSVLEDKFVFCKRNTPKQIVYVRWQKLSKPRKKILKRLLYQKRTKKKLKLLEIFGNFFKQKKKKKKKTT